MSFQDDRLNPSPLSTQYSWYRKWALGGFWVGIIPVVCFAAIAVLGKSNEIPFLALVLGAMITALGFFITACSYFTGVLPARRNRI